MLQRFFFVRRCSRERDTAFFRSRMASYSHHEKHVNGFLQTDDGFPPLQHLHGLEKHEHQFVNKIRPMNQLLRNADTHIAAWPNSLKRDLSNCRNSDGLDRRHGGKREVAKFWQSLLTPIRHACVVTEIAHGLLPLHK